MTGAGSDGRPLVAVLDYGIGNLHSAQKAIERMGADARLTADPEIIGAADGVVLPGVGAFGACMDALREAGLEQPALDAVASGRPFLGICVGMQMLFDRSDEDATARGLGVIPGAIRWIPPGVKRPQMQWNRLTLLSPDDPMLRHLDDEGEVWVYFVHSLHGVPDDPGVVVATCEYGIPVNAAFRRDNVFATQFHPEKSGRDGLHLLANFVEVRARVTQAVELYPAIDIRDGKVVRLTMGDYAAETTYADDPVAMAESFAAAGAPWVHVVDLDAARTGEPINRPVVAAIAAALRGRARLQTGGGVRSVVDVERLAEAGVSRVVMGSAAIRTPELVHLASKYLPVVVGLDHRGGVLATDGWTESSGLLLSTALDMFADAAAFVVTDISRDGMLSGPDVDGLAIAVKSTDVPVIASGGVASLDDIRRLGAIPGLAGVITGKALYEGRFTVTDALDALAGID